MKKSDIAMIILIASAAIMISFFIVNALPFLNAQESGVEVPTAEPISSDIEQPNPEVFNSRAINPTVRSVIGGGPSN